MALHTHGILKIFVILKFLFKELRPGVAPVNIYSASTSTDSSNSETASDRPSSSNSPDPILPNIHPAAATFSFRIDDILDGKKDPLESLPSLPQFLATFKG